MGRINEKKDDKSDDKTNDKGKDAEKTVESFALDYSTEPTFIPVPRTDIGPQPTQTYNRGPGDLIVF